MLFCAIFSISNEKLAISNGVGSDKKDPRDERDLRDQREESEVSGNR